MSSKFASSGKRILLRLAVAVAALLFSDVGVIVNIHQTVFSKIDADYMHADAAQFQLHGNTEISGRPVTQKNYTKATGDRTNATNTGMVGNSLQKANNINSKNASGLVLPNILIIGAQKGKYLTILVIHDLFHKNARI